jgi:hypothetical protein
MPMSLPMGDWGAPAVARAGIDLQTTAMAEPSVTNDTAPLDYTANCFTDGGPGLADMAGIELAKASRTVSALSSTGFSLAIGYRQAFERVLVSQDLAGLPRSVARSGSHTKPWHRNVNAFIDGLSRTFGIFSTSRRITTAEESIDNVLGRIEKAIDNAQKRGLK